MWVKLLTLLGTSCALWGRKESDVTERLTDSCATRQVTGFLCASVFSVKKWQCWQKQCAERRRQSNGDADGGDDSDDTTAFLTAVRIK